MNTEGEGQRALTYGEQAVGLTFNPGNNADVDAMKVQYAAIIDTLSNMRKEAKTPEQARILSVAITEAQSAQMWAVKGITFQY